MAIYNRQHLQQHFSKAAAAYDEAAVLQKLTAEELASRLDLIKLETNQITDLGAGTGFLTQLLRSHYPKADLIALDLSHQMLLLNKQRLNNKETLLGKLAKLLKASKTHFIQADVYHLPLANASQDLVTTNFMLQWCDDLDKVLQEIRRILRPGGLLMLGSLGPDTLKELRQAWVSIEGEAGHNRLNNFIDMHDLGDALIRNGFGQPVMDTMQYTLTYDEPLGVLRDLKTIGATNASQKRSLLGKDKFKQMLAAYENSRVAGKIPATFEVVHGHAWANQEIFKGPQRNKDGVYEISLDELSVLQTRK